MQKNKKLIIYVIVLIIFVLALGFFIGKNKREVKQEIPAVPESGIPQVLGDYKNFISFDPSPRSEVSGVVEATGVISGGYFFEGNIPIKIVDATKKVLKTTHGQASTDWMTSGPVTFKVTIDFTDLPKGPSYIVLTQDDPSGGESGRVPSEILVPIIIK